MTQPIQAQTGTRLSDGVFGRGFAFRAGAGGSSGGYRRRPGVPAAT